MQKTAYEVRISDWSSVVCLPISHLIIIDGDYAGRSVPIARVAGRCIRFAYAADQSLLNSVRAGARVRIDNAWALAVETYHRHQLLTPDMCSSEERRDGKECGSTCGSRW